MKKQRIKHNYIDKAKFHAEMTAYRVAAIEAEKTGAPKPRVNNFIGKCLYDICNNMSYRHNFINYSFREEMVGDAIENCLSAVDNFDPAQEKQNPFGYFCLIAWRAFVRRIKKEEAQAYTKHKYYHTSGIHDMLAYSEDSKTAGVSVMNNDVSNRIIEKFESKMNSKKEVKAVKGIEKFLED